MSDIKLEFTNNTWIDDEEIVTVKHFSDAKQVHYNSNPQKHLAGYKRLNKNTYINPTTGEIKTYKHNACKVPKFVAESVARGQDILIQNFAGHQNVIFFTLTFDKACMDIAGTQKYFNNFLKKIKRRYGELKYFYVIELQKERQEPSLHIHAAIKSMDMKRFRIENDDAKALWGHGITKTERLYNIEKISNYFFKDFFRAKNLKIYPKNSNICYHSTGLKPPKVEMLTMAEFISKYGDDYYLDGTTGKDVIDTKTNKVMCSNIDKIFKQRTHKRKAKIKYPLKRTVRFIKVEDDKMLCDDIYFNRRKGCKTYGLKITLNTKNTVLMDKVRKLKRKKKCLILLEYTFPIPQDLSNTTIIDILDENDVIINHLF